MMLRVRLLLACLATVLPTVAQGVDAPSAPEPQLGSIGGTVLDTNGDLLPGATVTLKCASPCEARTEKANDSAAFEFPNLKLGIPYQVRITADSFDDWTSSDIVLTPDRSIFFVTGVQLLVGDPTTSVTVMRRPATSLRNRCVSRSNSASWDSSPTFMSSTTPQMLCR